jgi:hypothetical protein
MWLCFYGATGGMLSTYWDWLFKGKDTYWFAGLMVGLAGFFLLWALPWYIILGRALVISLVWRLLTLQKSADIAEYGRGFILG